jgi:hypothetical protein
MAYFAGTARVHMTGPYKSALLPLLTGIDVYLYISSSVRKICREVDVSGRLPIRIGYGNFQSCNDSWNDLFVHGTAAYILIRVYGVSAATHAALHSARNLRSTASPSCDAMDIEALWRVYAGVAVATSLSRTTLRLEELKALRSDSGVSTPTRQRPSRACSRVLLPLFTPYSTSLFRTNTGSQ